jgi:predicted glycosyltransferase
MLEEDALSPAALAAAIDRAAAAPRPALGAIDLGGARRSAELLREWLA